MTGVFSEVGQLTSVMLHRPGEELRRLTPDNKDALLFDELLWVEHAQREHDAFAAALRDNGVTVHLMTDLLADTLADADVATAVVAEHISDARCGPAAAPALREFMLAMAPADLASALVAGVHIREIEHLPGLVAAVAREDGLLVDPLPNAVFTRDPSVHIGEGALLSPMRRIVRRRESALVRAILRHHKELSAREIWLDGLADPASVGSFEGGDVLVLGPRAIAVGLSERSSPAGVEALAMRLFDQDVLDRVLAVEIPHVRAAMHLDTIVTQVDVDQFVAYPAMTREAPSWQLTPAAGGGIDVNAQDDLGSGLAWALGIDAVRLIEPAMSATRAAREQWNDANNTLALAPGKVITYERNVATNEILTNAGLDVITIESFELPRGRGGPRCMSCPLSRDAV